MAIFTKIHHGICWGKIIELWMAKQWDGQWCQCRTLSGPHCKILLWIAESGSLVKSLTNESSSSIINCNSIPKIKKIHFVLKRKNKRTSVTERNPAVKRVCFLILLYLKEDKIQTSILFALNFSWQLFLTCVLIFCLLDTNFSIDFRLDK